MPIDNGSATALESFVSTNGGETYRGPFPVATISRHREAGGLRASPLPSAAISATGEVFVAWQDCRFSVSCGANDIVYSRSTDGRQWSEVARVPLDPPASGVDHFLPGLAVDPLTAGATASLALTYYFYPEAACKTSTCQLDVGFARSSDGGASWSSPLQLAGPIRLHELPHTTQGYMVGDYLSSSFVAGATGDTPLSAFAVGMRVPGTRCKLTSVGSCDEPIEAPDGTSAASIAPATIAAAPGSAEATAHTPPPRSSGEALTAR